MQRPRFVLACLAMLTACDDSPTATLVAPLPEFSSVALGANHSCALARNGAPYCWGRGATGALGIDSLSSVTSPVPVASGGFLFAQLSARADHTCATTPAGEVYCWGEGRAGQLGTGLKSATRGPLLVAGTRLYASVVTGGGHTCALTTDGAAYCWGRGDHGELGTAVPGDADQPTARTGYARSYRSLTLGQHHTCGLRLDGITECWGWNSAGQLGLGHTIGLGLPEAIGSSFGFQSVSAGDEHTCGVTTTGSAYCWGRGDSGQLGTGDVASSRVPVQVRGALTVSVLAAASVHTCGLIATGEAFCWGSNGDGQLGTGGNAGTRAEPVAVSGGLRFRDIAAGARHTCGVTQDGGIYCWGFGGFGQLGNGLAVSQLTPTRVAGR
jgi:alpha-tubulin suppressor-like RCC1 family protein